MELPRHRQHADEPWSTPNLPTNTVPYINNSQYPPQTSVYGSQSTVFDKSAANLTGATPRRDMGRTPSPTPSEAKEMKTGAFDWQALSKWRFWIRKEWIWYYLALAVILTLTALMTIYHKQIVHWLTPVTRWMHDLKFGWLVPIGILFVISFPPLFGHEIVAVLCGLVWGLWIGFGIVAAGTFIGEVGNFYAFKYCCRARGEKMERTKITYACLAKVVRDGGFRIALIARLSAIPGHFTTAVFSTCGMGIIVFSIAAILSLPKQFITVYLGVILEQSSNGTEDKKSRIISDVVLVVTFLITIAAMWYIYHKMNQVKPEVIYARRKARQAKMYSAMSTSEVNIPLTSPAAQYAFAAPQHQFGSNSPKLMYAPTPTNPPYQYKPSNNYGSEGDVSHQAPPPGIVPYNPYDDQPYATPVYDQYSSHPQPYASSSHPNPQVYAKSSSSSPIHSQPSSPRRRTTAPEPEEELEPLTPRVAHHQAEPTGMSYHTAVGSEHQYGSSSRPSSPPPPSYMTHAR